MFADDCTLNAASEADILHSVDKFSDACNNFGPTIRTKKTEAMYQPDPVKPYVEPNASIIVQRLNPVDKFNCLGCALYGTVAIDVDV